MKDKLINMQEILDSSKTLGIKDTKKVIENIASSTKTMISEENLLKEGFKANENGIFWKDIDVVHYIELISSSDGYYYPLLCEIGEMSHQNDQVVSLKRILYMEEITNIIKLIV